MSPRIVAKRQRRLSGTDDLVVSLSAKGLTHGEMCAHLGEVYGAEVSKQAVSTITDRVMGGMGSWQNRPVDPVYPVMFIDAVNAGDPGRERGESADLGGAGGHGGGQARGPGPLGW